MQLSYYGNKYIDGLEIARKAVYSELLAMVEASKESLALDQCDYNAKYDALRSVLTEITELRSNARSAYKKQK